MKHDPYSLPHFHIYDSFLYYSCAAKADHNGDVKSQLLFGDGDLNALSIGLATKMIENPTFAEFMVKTVARAESMR
jgi:hypothetical protein